MQSRDLVSMLQFLMRALVIVLALGLGLRASAQQLKLKTAQFDPVTEPAPRVGLPSEKQAGAKPAGATLKGGELRVAIVQWADGITNEKLDAFVAAGGQLLQPLPTNAYLAMVPAGMDLKSLGQQKALAGKNAPRWAGEMAPEWKLDPRVKAHLTAQLKADANATTVGAYVVQFALTGGEKEVRGMLRSLSADARLLATDKNFETWVVQGRPAQIEALARLNAVLWIEPYATPKLLSERAGLAIANEVNSTGSDIKPAGAYAAWLNKVGLSGAGVTVQVIDDGLSQGIDTNLPGTAHPDILGRIAGIDNPTNDEYGDSQGGHGHLNASIIMGQPIAGGGLKDYAGYLLGQGIAPNAKVFATKILSDNIYYVGQGVTTDALVQTAYQKGARISSNSWGLTSAFGPVNFYEFEAQRFDRLTRDANGVAGGYQPMIFIFAAGNDGNLGSSTVASPGLAKNVICVGAGEGSDKSVIDGSHAGPDGADDLRDIADFSSRGPALDGRLLPTLFAPGTHVSGAASDSRKFDGGGVSGRLLVEPDENVNARKYYPAHQNFYTWSSGTSHACPTVAGAAALLYEFYLKKYGVAPSPAMMKAMLVAGTVDTAGGNRNFLQTNSIDKLMPVPNPDAGWGRCSIAGIVDGTRQLFSVDQASTFTYPTQVFQYKVTVTDTTKPLRVVLAWTDPPASTVAATTLVNDLDLTVSNGMETWRGNVFANGESVTGGTADRLNNLECVFIKKPVPAVYTITISAFNVMGDALPSTGNKLEQDFALFATNGAKLSSAGQLSFDETWYRNGQTVRISLADLDRLGQGSTQVKVNALHTLDTETVTLTEVKDAQGKASGIFRGTINYNITGAVTPNNGSLSVIDHEILKAYYTDNSSTRIATAYFDLIAPTLKSQEFTEIFTNWAKMRLVTNEPTSVTVTYGERPSRLRLTQSSLTWDTEHELLLAPLYENTPYFYTIEVNDQAGNKTVYNNKGVYYTFQTKRRKSDYLNNFETDTNANPGGWTRHTNSGQNNDWSLVKPYLDENTGLGDPTNQAWVTYDQEEAKDVCLVSPSFTLNERSVLGFKQWYRFQQISRMYGYDGGVLEISTDNGVSWQDLGSQVTNDPGTGWICSYDAMLFAGNGNTLGGRMAWSGRSFAKLLPGRGWAYDMYANSSFYKFAMPVAVDLSKYAGQTVKFRFRIATNNGIGGDRWIVDDFELWHPQEGVTPLARIKFDKPQFNGGVGRIRFTLSDSGLSAASGASPSAGNFRMASSEYSDFPDGLPCYPEDLHPIDASGVWEGYIPITSADPANKRVEVAYTHHIGDGQWVRIIYDDPNVYDELDPEEALLYTVSDTATLDWTAPELVENYVSEVRHHDFKVSLTANEPVTVTLKLGTSMSNLNKVYTYNVLATGQVAVLTQLGADTPYYYTVTLRDAAGNIGYFDNDGYGFGVRTKSYTPVSDTLDPPTMDWTQDTEWGSDPATNQWKLVENQNAHSPTRSWFGPNSPGRSDKSLILRNVEIQDGYKLRFWHSYQFETGKDGGVIEISTDQGETWEDLGPRIIAGIPYNYVLSWGSGNALGGRSAWSGTLQGSMQEVTIELSPYAGTGRWIRWRMACDDTGLAGTGWYIDDITLDKYGPSTLEFPGKPSMGTPANNTGDIPYDQYVMLTWPKSTGATKYQVYVGTDPEQLTKLTETVSTSFPITAASLKPTTKYYWRVVAVNGAGVVPGNVQTFRTRIIDPTKFANHLIGKSTLTGEELDAVDMNKDGKVNVLDLIYNIKNR